MREGGKFIFAIDPGNEKSAYALLNPDLRPILIGKKDNEEVRMNLWDVLDEYSKEDLDIAIEMVASYGMAVGKTVFETCVEIGRFTELIVDRNGKKPTYVYRMEEKMTLCHDSRAKDSNIRQALIDRFGEVGTKKNPGWFYGVSKDIWAAIAVGVTYHDIYLKKEV